MGHGHSKLRPAFIGRPDFELAPQIIQPLPDAEQTEPCFIAISGLQSGEIEPPAIVRHSYLGDLIVRLQLHPYSCGMGVFGGIIEQLLQRLEQRNLYFFFERRLFGMHYDFSFDVELLLKLFAQPFYRGRKPEFVEHRRADFKRQRPRVLDSLV